MTSKRHSNKINQLSRILVESLSKSSIRVFKAKGKWLSLKEERIKFNLKATGKTKSEIKATKT